MPLQNRVTPFGEIVAIPERGTLMGNRGILHDPQQHIRRRWAGRAWISCVLEFQGRRVQVMAPGHYTQLFFLDEPTAFAAGHRPCAYCRRADYLAFRDTWARANAHLGLGVRPRATELDRVLHSERLDEHGRKRLHRVDLGGLPDGTMVTAETGLLEHPGKTVLGPSLAAPDPAETPRSLRSARYQGGVNREVSPNVYLIWGGTLWQWSPAGYAATDVPFHGEALVLTPPSIVATLRAGYAMLPPAGL